VKALRGKHARTSRRRAVVLLEDQRLRRPAAHIMSTNELKTEIQKKLDEVPDAILHEVLEYLRGFQAKTPEEQKRVIGLKRILDEKRDLLLRLAQ
jgi:hypothetical protein